MIWPSKNHYTSNSRVSTNTISSTRISEEEKL